MSIVVIPTDIASLNVGTAPAAVLWNETVQLEGTEYLLEFLWSGRESCWYLSIGNQDGDWLGAGIPLVLGAILLRRFWSTEGMPRGLLMLIGPSTDADMTLPADLGTSHILMYATSDETTTSGLGLTASG